MDQEHIVEYELTEELAGRLSRVMVDRYFYDHAFHRFAPFVLIALLCGLMFVFSMGWLERDMFGYLLVVVSVLVGYAWFRRVLLFRDFRWLALLPLQGRESMRMRLSLTPTLVSLSAGGEHYEAEWEELASVWALPDFWLLRMKNGVQFLIPTAMLTPELEALIRGKAEQTEARLLEE